VLGEHIEQKGSLVNDKNLRFDFSHFQKVSDEELREVEALVNDAIRSNYDLNENRAASLDEAKSQGAMALFGEKYGDKVRVIQFGDSIELCGGTHVASTSQIGKFIFTNETAVAAGVRRIEAITSTKAEDFLNKELTLLNDVRALLKNPKDVKKHLESMLSQNTKLQKEVEGLVRDKAKGLKSELNSAVTEVNGVNFLASTVDLDSTDAIKDLAFQMRSEIDNLFMVLGAEINGKPNLTVVVSENLVKDKGLNAGQIIRDLAKEIQGGGGGQPFYATAGGKNIAGISVALEKAKSFIV